MKQEELPLGSTDFDRTFPVHSVTAIKLTPEGN